MPSTETEMGRPKTLSVPQAGRDYFDLGRNASYEAARRGDIPVIRIGRILRVPVIALERMLDISPQGDCAAEGGEPPSAAAAA